MPNKSGEKYYLFWFKKAEEDELSIRAVIKEGSPSTACFLAQQMAEKLLKGLLVFYKEEFPKMHDLLELKELISGVAPEVSQLHNDLVLLNRYYTGARYPDDQETEFTYEECQRAYKAAQNVKKFVLEIIKK